MRHSLLFNSVNVHSFSRIEDSVIFPNASIGRKSRIRNAVIDKGCQIPAGTIIGEDPEKDAGQFHVTENGVVLVTPEMLGQRLHYAR